MAHKTDVETKGYWIEVGKQKDIFGNKTLMLTANICPYGRFDEKELRKNAKEEMRQIAKDFKGHTEQRVQLSAEFSGAKQVGVNTVKDKAGLRKVPD